MAAPLPLVSMAARGRFLLDYIDLLLADRSAETEGFRHLATGGHLATDHLATDHLHERQIDNCQVDNRQVTRRGRDRHVVNKLRALCAWYTRGLENGSHLRHTINRTESVAALRQVICDFFET